MIVAPTRPVRCYGTSAVLYVYLAAHVVNYQYKAENRFVVTIAL
jgi:hypothetical protein